MKRFTFLACAAMMAYTASAATTVHEGQGMSGADAYTEMTFNYLGSEPGDHPDLTAKVVYTLTPTADNHLDVTAEFVNLDPNKFIGLVDACYLNINGETPMTLADGKYTATTSQTFEEGKSYTGFFKRMSAGTWYGGDLLFNFSFTYTTQSEPTPGDDFAPEKLYMIGHVNNTNFNPMAGVEMTKEGNTFTITATINSSNEGKGYFFFSPELSDDWDGVLAAKGYGAAANNAPVTIGEAMTLAQGKNSFEIAAAEYTFTVTFSENAATMLVEQAEAPAPELVPVDIWNKANAKVATVYYAPGWNQSDKAVYTLEGDAFNVELPDATYERWQAQFKIDTDLAMKADEVYDLEFDVKSNTSFTALVKLLKVGDDNLFHVSDDMPLVADETYHYSAKGLTGKDIDPVEILFDFGTNPANTNIEVTNIRFIKYVEEEPAPAEVPEKLFIVGTIAGASWTPEASPEMTKEGNTFSIDVTFENVVDGVAQPNSLFSFLPALGTWGDVNAATRYGAANEDIFELGAAQALVAQAGEVAAFNVNYTGDATVVVDFDTMTVTVTAKSDSIDTIGADADAPVVYYNLNGVRVDNPQGGIFIRKQGNTVSKVIVK